MIIVKTASNAGAVFNSTDFESMNVAATLVTANFRTVDSGDTPTRDALALNCTAGKEHEVARGLADLIKSERTIVLDDVNDDFAGLSDVTSVSAATINGVPAVSGFHVVDKDADFTLSAADSGAYVAVKSGNDIKLPTPAVGLNYTFFAAEDIATTDATIKSTSDGSSVVALMFGSITDGGAADPIDNDSTLTLNQGTATDSVVIRAYCVGTGTTANDQTWLIEGQTGVAASVTPSA
jgi:hypothetical protein